MTNCLHCDQIASSPLYIQKESNKTGPFCCQGCITVFNILKNKGLSEYYEIKKNVAIFKDRAPVEISLNQYTYLDNLDFQQEYSYLNYQKERTIEFYLEGIHCLACLWIIEKLPTFVPGITSSKLNIGRSVAVISIDDSGSFSLVARELDNIGYRPHPLKINQNENLLKIKENRINLLRIGISGAAAGNIMLYAISLYAGAGEEYEQLFNAITVAFALPVLSYCAYPFYKNSYNALKNKSLSIDVPISIALIMGAVMGVYNLIIGVPENYFDSLTALVFLLLLSRYFLKIIQEKGLSTSDLNFFYQGESLLKSTSEDLSQFVEIHPKLIIVGDIIKIVPNQIIPADATIIRGQSYLNTSLLSGESELQKVNEGSLVYSGTQNVSNELIVRVTSLPKESRLGKILQHIENGWSQKSKIVDITNVVSKYFVLVVFLLSLFLFFVEFQSGELRSAFEKALTLLIVTCPCALAIATPLTFIRSLSKSAEKGIVIKDDAVIENLAKAKVLFIDKTGTITENKIQICDFKIHQEPAIDFELIIHALEQHSRHPVALSLKNYFPLTKTQLPAVQDFKESPGVGVSGSINQHNYLISQYSIFEDNRLVASFNVDTKIKKDAFDSIKSLKKLGLKIQILSGDKNEKVESLARSLDLQSEEFAGELSPEMKNSLIKASSHSIMIGDGANDALALNSANTGIAVHGAMDISLRAADVYLTTPGLDHIVKLIVMSRETMKVIYRNLVLSLLYNSFSVVLAFTGYISPLTAAIIMPLSSLTVLISSLIGTKELRSQWK